MNRLRTLIAIAAVAACHSPTMPATTSDPSAGLNLALYLTTDLGSLPYPSGPAAEAMDVNDQRQVVGWSGPGAQIIPPRVTHAFLWDSVMIDLGTLGGENSRALFINNHTQVAGWSLTAAGEQHAFLWELGAMIDVGTLGGSTSTPNGLTEDGAIVGASTTSAGATHAFLWKSGVLQDLGTLGGDYSSARAANGRMQVVGESWTTAGDTHAFLWEGDVLRDLGTLGGSFSTASSISESGAITGQSTDSAGVAHAFLWQDGVMQRLDELPGFTTSTGKVVTTSGTVAGQVTGGPFLEVRGVIWTPGGVRDLGALYPPRPRTTVTAMNERHQVAGGSSTSASVSSLHAVLWEDGELRDLGVLQDHRTSFANALNAGADVVGWSSTSSTGTADTRHAVLWQRLVSASIPVTRKTKSS